MKVEISDKLYKRLQSFAEPFVDTPETIISRALDSLENKNSMNVNLGEQQNQIKPLIFRSINELPSIKHTSDVSVTYDDKKVETKNWASLLREVLIHSGKIVGNTSDLIALTRANLVFGEGDHEKGFEFIPKLNCSFQRCDADQTLRHVTHLAKALNFGLIIEFEWRNVEKASHPGKRGKLIIESVGVSS